MQDFFRPKPSELTPEERAERYIREAEKSKARMFQAPGKDLPYYEQQQILPNLLDPVPVLNSVHQRVSDEPDLHILRSQLHMAMIDEEYDSVSVHVDQFLKEKIEKGEYVDLARLLPKDRVQAIDDADKQTLQLFHKDGQTFYAPPVSQGVAISSYGKWDKAFRIFSNIYLKKYPNRALELNEYNHTIHHISQTYIWDNCYAYDKEFRYFMSIHPERSWGTILHKAWSFRLNDKIRFHGEDYNNNNNRSYHNRFHRGNGNNHGNKEPCGRFNRGRCTYGASCKFDHRCKYCSKFGHGIHNCRKLQADKDKDNKYRSTNESPKQMPADTELNTKK